MLSEVAPHSVDTGEAGSLPPDYKVSVISTFCSRVFSLYLH